MSIKSFADQLSDLTKEHLSQSEEGIIAGALVELHRVGRKETTTREVGNLLDARGVQLSAREIGQSLRTLGLSANRESGGMVYSITSK